MAVSVGTKATDANAAAGQTAMQDLESSDPEAFAKLMKDSKNGNGNAIVQDALDAYKNGKISQADAKAILNEAQQTANAHGGGVINKKMHKEAEEAMGGSNEIANGKTRALIGFEKFLKNFTGVGAIVTGIESKVKGNHASVSMDLTVNGASATQSGVQTAMQDMQQADPTAYAKFVQDAQSGNGNAMVEDLVAMKGEISNSDAQILGTQVQTLANDKNKGRINSEEHEAFKDAFGEDTITKGKTRGELALDKVGNFVSGLIKTAVSPVVDGVAAAKDVVQGNFKGAFSELGQAAVGVALDAMAVTGVGAVAGTVARAGTAAVEGATATAEGAATAATTTAAEGASAATSTAARLGLSETTSIGDVLDTANTIGSRVNNVHNGVNQVNANSYQS